MATLLNLDTPSKLPGIRPLVAAPPAAMTIPEQGDALPSLAPTLRPIVTSPREQRIQFLQQQIQKEQQPGPSKPGFWHRLGHIAAGIGNIAGDAMIPATMEMIPGTQLHNRLELNHNSRELAGLQAMDDAEENSAAKRSLEGAQTANIENPPAQALPTAEGFFSFNPHTGNVLPLESHSGMQLQPIEKSALQHVVLSGKDGKPVAAMFNPHTGTYLGPDGMPISDPTPYEKPTAPSELSMWLSEHPGKTVDDFMAVQNSLKPEFPRIQPVTDAQGNTHGYIAFSGTGGGVHSQYIPITGIGGAPQNLGDTPGVIPPKPTASVLTQSQRSEMIQPQVNALERQIQKTASELGPLAGRWNDIMTGRAGANNPGVAALQMQLTLFTTALMLAHGLRGEEYERALGKYLHASQSPQNLMARVQAANQYLEDYAASSGHAPDRTGEASASSGAPPKPLGKTSKPDGLYRMNGKTYRVESGEVYAAE